MKTWLIIVACLFGAYLLIPAVPFILMAIGLFAIARMLFRIGSWFSRESDVSRN